MLEMKSFKKLFAMWSPMATHSRGSLYSCSTDNQERLSTLACSKYSNNEHNTNAKLSSIALYIVYNTCFLPAMGPESPPNKVHNLCILYFAMSTDTTLYSTDVYVA